MKNTFTFLLSLLFSTHLFASNPAFRTVPLDNIFIPAGFTSIDSAEIVITGVLPNLCYRYPQTSVYVKDKTIDIQVMARYGVPPLPLGCTNIVVPFMETIRLGVLDKGKFEITVNKNAPINSHRASSSIKINEASASALDLNTYANVEYIDKELNTRTISLKGHNPSDCFQFKEIKTLTNSKDTITILPIMEKVFDFCPMKMIPFEYKMEVPTGLNPKKILLHVRGMNGHSVNSLFYNE